MTSFREKRRTASPTLGREERRAARHNPQVLLHTMPHGGDHREQGCTADAWDPQNCHVAIESILTVGTGATFRGFLNWAAILLLITHVYMSLECISKNGLFAQFGDPFRALTLFLKDPSDHPAMFLIIGSNIFILIAYQMEKLMTWSRNCAILGKLIQCTNLLVLIVCPVVIIHRNKSITPVGAMLALAVYITLTFKLLSYKFVNDTYRARHPKNAKGALKKVCADSRQYRNNDQGWAREVVYPSNLNMYNLYYFVFAPTLCYQLNYPKTTKFRWSFFLARIVELGLLFQIMITHVRHLILPVIHKSMKPMWEVESSRFLGYILKLAVTTNIVWILFSYWFFHSFLNAVAEVLYFADREFYQEWWETKSILKFWTKWNRPTHNWLLRHVYIPLKGYGYEKLHLQLIVFLISSIVFEGLVAIPLRKWQFLIFTVMFAQFILAWIQEKIFGDDFGNLIVWLNIFFGIPIVLLLYFHDYYVKHQMIDSSWRLYY